MAIAIRLNETAKEIDFKMLSQHESNATARVRAIILSNVKKGKTKTEIANTVGVHRVTVASCITRVNENGPNGLYDKKRSGRPPKMSAEDKQVFLGKFQQAQKDRKGGRLNGNDAKQMLEEMGFKFGLSQTYNLLHELKLSWITSRSIHPKADEMEQDNFKKTSQRLLKP